ncbi:MAG TPA: pilus assembly protein TadG-related protein [Candidatus Limnocylindrales bacterium]|nr:pilus assembly protein TadG-related protein [Candidatus Limnocylindrales bacterium]
MPKRSRTRGQIMIVFAMSIIVLCGMVALVVDVSWYWANSLRVQRAADAAALAGVVWLPGTPNVAYSTAIIEAEKNGYINGAKATITPLKDATNDRRLNVKIATTVDTFFMRVLGISSLPVIRNAKAEFVLPVPMGSPQNYYGVGFFEGLTGGSAVTYGPNLPSVGITTSPNNQFSNRSSALTSNNVAATGTVGTGATGSGQAYGNFGFSIPGSNTVAGIEVRLEAKASDPAGCRLAVELSPDNGGTWSTTNRSVDLTGSDPGSGSWPVLGGATDPWGLTWGPADVANGRLQVRLRAFDPETNDDASNSNAGRCNNSATVSVDAFTVTVFSHTARVKSVLSVLDPVSGLPLAPQNIWGAVFTSGGVRENGDRYAPASLGNGAGGSKGDPNPNYDPNGYDYTVELSGGATNGQVRLFDPIFCATGDNGHGGSFGAGDHWTDHAPSQVIAPVAVTYRLYDMRGTPLDASDDGAPVATLHYDPGAATLGDFSGDFGTPANSTSGNRQDCASNPAHNRWVSLASGLAQGMYRVNVNTTVDGGNSAVGAENLFSIHVTASSGRARVYGGGRMAAYANMDTATSLFYLAQIEAAHASKTMVIRLFDPGESAGDAFLRVKSPDGNAYNNVNFTWVADDGRTGSGTQIQTSVGGSPQFNNHLITISIPLPTTYGSTGLTPAGETEPGWWKIEYQMSAANDTTTWEVAINGNPVHLLLP